MTKFSILSFVALFLLSAKSFSQLSGEVILTNISKGSDTSKNHVVRYEVLYNGNYSIQQIPHLKMSRTQSDSSEKINITYFLLIDPLSKTYSYYQNFSDTAHLVFKYKGEKPPFAKYGGWYLNSTDMFSYDKSCKIKDTVINDKHYERYKYSKENNGGRNDYVLYTVNSQKEIPIKLLKPFAQKIDKTIVRMDVYYNDKLVMISTLEYRRSYLTEKEKGVFLKWTK